MWRCVFIMNGNQPRRIINYALAISFLVVGAFIAATPFPHPIIESNAGTYSLNLSASSTPYIPEESFGSGVQTTRYVAFSYELADDSNANAHIRLASVGGKFYNTDIITDVDSFKAVFTGGTLYVGGANHLGEIENSVQLYSDTNCFTLPDYPYYVFYSGASGDVTLTSLRIDYYCENPTIAQGMVLTEFDDYIEVTSYTGNSLGVTIPAYHNGKLITKIGDEAFKNNTSLKSVILPNTITSIDAYAFAGCTAIENFFQSENLQTIGAYAFSHCESLDIFDFPLTLTSIGDHAFQYCYSLQGVNLPTGITIIREQTFSICTSISSFHIPSSITTIETGALSGSSILYDLYIPITVTTIQRWVFASITNCIIRVQADSIPSGWDNEFIMAGHCKEILWGQDH